jgi:hypothetical protein
MNGLKSIFIFSAVLGFLLSTVPANHSEAEDAYAYAWQAQQQGTSNELFHAHHLLYLPLMRLAVRALPFWSSLSVLTGVSAVCGALTVLLVAVLLRGRGSGFWFAGALLFSYGFWRYSTTAEIYVPASLFAVCSLFCAERSEMDARWVWGGAVTGALAVLLHLIALPAVLAAVPLYYGFRRQWRRMGVHVVSVVLIVGAVYGAVLLAGISPYYVADSEVVRGALFEPGTWLKACFAWGQTLLSGNFVFSFRIVADWLVELFPYHMLQEECFAGQHAPRFVRQWAPATMGFASVFLAAGVLIPVGWLFRIARGWKRFVPVLIWFLGTAGMALLFEPANPEMWVGSLIPFFLLLGRVWEQLPPVVVVRRVPIAICLALLVHNAIGGMSVVWSEQGDYCRQKARVLDGVAQEGDLVLTAESNSFVTFLRYSKGVTVLDGRFASIDSFKEAISEEPSRVLVLEDVLNPLSPVLKRSPKSVQTLRDLSAFLTPELSLVRRSEFGAAYEWKQD